MVGDKKEQKARDNSTQVQADIINNITIGIDEKRAREICDESFKIMIRDFTQEAYACANERVKEFENTLMPKIMQVDKAIDAFSDPAFQILLSKAQRKAASSEYRSDYELLSELLVQRINKKEIRKVCTGINHAVEIIDEISDEALLGLTISFAVEKLIYSSGDINQGLDGLNNLFEHLCYNTLPSGIEWIENLDILNAARISPIEKLKKLESFYAEKMPGYCAVGIRINSDNYYKALQLVSECGLPDNTLIIHSLNTDYVRIPVVNEQNIDSITLSGTIDIDGNIIPVNNILLNSEQQKALHQIYGMYEKNEALQNHIMKNFCDEIIKRPVLNKIRAWWNNIPQSFHLTSVGRVLAYANAKRIDKNIPDFDQFF